jgi:integrase/DNA-binding MarR family transcriptional regulator
MENLLMDIETQANIEIMLNVVNKIRKKLGIQSVQQLEILLAVMMHEEQQQNQIEKSLGLSPAQLSMNLPWMKTNGLVADHTGPDKSRMIDLTPKTKQFRDRLLKTLAAGFQFSAQGNNKKTGKKKKLPMGLRWRGDIIQARFMVKGKCIQVSTKTDNIKEAKAILRELRAEERRKLREREAVDVQNQTAKSHKVLEENNKGTSRNQKLPHGLVWRGGTLHTNFLFKGKRIKKNTGTDNIKEAKEFLRRTKMDIQRENDKTRSQKQSFKISPSDKKIINTVYKVLWADKVDGVNCKRRVEIALEQMGCSLVEVDSMSIDKFIGEMKSQKKSNSTINNYMNCLFIVLRKAQDYGMMEQIPRKPKSLNKPNNTRVFAPEEIHALLEYFRDISGDLENPDLTPAQKEHLQATHCNHHTAINLYTRDAMRDLIIVLLDTGMRLGETLKMEYGRHIDLKEAVINLSASITKTARPRVVKMTDRVLEILKRRSKIPKNKNRAFNISRDRAIQTIQVYRKKMGIKDREFKLHALRHTFASRQIRKGVDLYTLSKLLGHASVSTTQMYAHLVQQNLDDAMAVLHGDSYSKLKE